jgi:hypothetical protein
VSLEDRWTLIGATGTGKTTFANELLDRLKRAYPAANIYVLDTKQSGRDFEHLPGRIRTREAPDALATPGAIQVWQPDQDDVSEYDKWFTRIYEARKPAIVLVDELSNIGGSTGRSYPRGYNLLMKQGRALAISVISLTQEAAYIPRSTFGQTTHIVRFSLRNAYDGKEADRAMGREQKELGQNPPDRYGFYYATMNTPGRIRYYSDYKRFFSR